MSYLPHLQANQYKDAKTTTRTIRKLHGAGKLNELQSRFFTIPRPVEELYDLEADPHETVNLATNPDHSETLIDLRKSLQDWMIESRDCGLIPEPLLEEFGRNSGSKYAVLQSKLSRASVRALITEIETGERGEPGRLDDPSPAVRYWAATWAGNHKDKSVVPQLQKLLNDEWEPVRIAAALALCKMGQNEAAAIAILVELIDSSNPITGMYAIRGIEWSGIRNATTKAAADKAEKSSYEFTRRIGRRLQGQH